MMKMTMTMIMIIFMFQASSRKNSQSGKNLLHQKRDQKIASLLILVVLVFGSCNIVRVFTNFYEVIVVAIYEEVDDTWPPW